MKQREIDFRNETPRVLVRTSMRSLALRAPPLASRAACGGARSTLDDAYLCVFEERVLNQKVPIDFYDDFRGTGSAGNELYRVSQFMCCKTAQTLFAQRKPIGAATSSFLTLTMTMVVRGNQPNVLDYLQGHPVTIIVDGDCRMLRSKPAKRDNHVCGVSIICVLDQLEYGKAGRANELISQHLQQPRAGPKG
jgi:hypothetical protein